MILIKFDTTKERDFRLVSNHFALRLCELCKGENGFIYIHLT